MTVMVLLVSHHAFLLPGKAAPEQRAGRVFLNQLDQLANSRPKGLPMGQNEQLGKLIEGARKHVLFGDWITLGIDTPRYRLLPA